MCNCKHCTNPFCNLTPREQELLDLMVTHPGASNQQLAKKLTVAESTIKKYLHNIFRTLEVHSRAHAILCYLHFRESGMQMPQNEHLFSSTVMLGLSSLPLPVTFRPRMSIASLGHTVLQISHPTHVFLSRINE